METQSGVVWEGVGGVVLGTFDVLAMKVDFNLKGDGGEREREKAPHRLESIPTAQQAIRRRTLR